MKNGQLILCQNRRNFLSTILSAVAIPWFNPKEVFSYQQEKHKFNKNFNHTYEEAFNWRFGFYIDLMERFADYLGKDKLIEMIKRANDDHYKMNSENDPDFSFVKWLEGGGQFMNMMSRDIVEKSETVYEMHVTECLWAETFKKRNAADIGYATICYSDYGSAAATHPKLKLTRTKTIMEGHGYCNHRWEYNG